MIFIQIIRNLLSKFPVKKLTTSLLIYEKFAPKVFERAEKTIIEKFFEEIYLMFLKMIEENQEEDFQLWFFDQVLKFGCLIEGYFKDLLKIELKLDCLLKNKDFKEIADKNRTMGQIFRTLDRLFR